jgi:hypothetical protein
VPVIAASKAPLSPLTAHYCDLCADDLESTETKRFATLIAAALLCITASSTLALFWGSVAPERQVALTLAFGLVTFWALRHWDRRWVPPLVLLGGRTPRLAARRRRYLEELADARPREIPAPQPRLTGRSLLPLGAALAWLAAVHFWGTAKVVVVVDGVETALVTIDHRLRARAQGITEERPGAGTTLLTLGGRRHVSLIREDGEVLVDREVTLWPTRTYILSSPELEGCFFVETQQYGRVGSAHTLEALTPPGPIWQLPVAIDRWFAPPKERADLETSGGERRALRLLPCRKAPLAARTP